jgi:hypothetical protein
MPVIIESRRKKPTTLAKLYPAALVADVTSKGPKPWVRFSPFFPHGGIPIPNTPEEFAASVEGLWQGLKVFEKEDTNPSKWAITTMREIKRSGKSRGAVRGHRFGVGSAELLGYRGARYRIYLPAYRWCWRTASHAKLSNFGRNCSRAPSCCSITKRTRT